MRGRAVVVQAAVAAGALGLAAWTWLRPLDIRRCPARWRRRRSGPARSPRCASTTASTRSTWCAPRPVLPGFGCGSHAVPRSPLRMPAHPTRGAAAPPDAGSPLRSPDAGVHRSEAEWSVLQALREAPPPPDRELRGNELAEQLLDRVAPLMAIRDLGMLGPDRREALGLGAATKRLRIEAPGNSVEFRVSTPPGATGTYLLGPDGRVWVVADALTQDLTAASSRLVDRRLHAFKPEDPDTVTLTADGRTRSYVVRRVQGLNKLAPADSPDAPSAEATAWADRVWRLTPVELLGKGEVPREGTPQLLFRVEYLRNRRPLGHLELAPGGQRGLRADRAHRRLGPDARRLGGARRAGGRAGNRGLTRGVCTSSSAPLGALHTRPVLLQRRRTGRRPFRQPVRTAEDEQSDVRIRGWCSVPLRAGAHGAGRSLGPRRWPVDGWRVAWTVAWWRAVRSSRQPRGAPLAVRADGDLAGSGAGPLRGRRGPAGDDGGLARRRGAGAGRRRPGASGARSSTVRRWTRPSPGPTRRMATLRDTLKAQAARVHEALDGRQRAELSDLLASGWRRRWA